MPMGFEILTADGADAKRWHALVEGLPQARRDIHFLPEYGRVYRLSHGFEPLLALYCDDDGYVIQPLVRRPLDGLPFIAAAADGGGHADIANPYGYGGPLSNRDGLAARRLYARFAADFADWCDKRDLASEFASLHPFLVDHQLALIGDALAPRHEKDVVFIDLERDRGAVSKDLRKGHCSSIALARRSGVRVERVDANAVNIAAFSAIYYATMRRRHAASRWFVPECYFPACVGELGAGRTSLFFATVGGELESACLLLHEFGTAYYHFAATAAKYPALGVNNLMVFEAAIWARARGYRRYHLGGGVTSDKNDSLLRFKSGFSGCRAPLYTYFCVRDPIAYDRLCERKRAHERAASGLESSSDFLPLYRRQ
jgi:hypothetical protein